jgi:hypothetical protein
MKHKFVGGEVKSLRSKLLPIEREKVMKNLLSFYSTCYNLENSYDFTDENVLKCLKATDRNTVEFSEFEEAVQVLNFTEICEQFSYDYFYEEFSKRKQVLLEISCAQSSDICKKVAIFVQQI